MGPQKLWKDHWKFLQPTMIPINKDLFLWEEVGTGGVPFDLLWFPDLFCREVMTQEEHTGKAGFPGGKRDVGFFLIKLSAVGFFREEVGLGWSVGILLMEEMLLTS